jgi:hypothetical protein
MREIVSPLDGFASPFGVRGGLSIAALNKWFLASGEWEATGLWLDGVAFPVPWFLASGRWNFGGLWDDSEAWT